MVFPENTSRNVQKMKLSSGALCAYCRMAISSVDVHHVKYCKYVQSIGNDYK